MLGKTTRLMAAKVMRPFTGSCRLCGSGTTRDDNCAKGTASGYSTDDGLEYVLFDLLDPQRGNRDGLGLLVVLNQALFVKRR
jgi:hypothetical protein